MLVKTSIWIAVVASLLQTSAGKTGVLDLPTVAMLLGGIAAEIADARFLRSSWFALTKTALFVASAAVSMEFGLLAASAAYDLARHGPAPAAVVPPVIVAAILSPGSWIVLGLASALAVAAGWATRVREASEARHLSAIDRERASRYRLEEAQRRLDQMSGELVRTTERAERTRIAQEMHDGVGHRLTGALMQLQAAELLAESQPHRARTMLSTGIVALQATCEAVRETVYDLRPRPESDSAMVRRLAAECRLCPVELSLDDDSYAALPASHREACVAALRELLSNAVCHSRANRIDVRIEGRGGLRLVYRDDGMGAPVVREGLGLGGIRSRAEALGGAVAVSGHDGFVVRCLIPVREEHGQDTSSDR